MQPLLRLFVGYLLVSVAALSMLGCDNANIPSTPNKQSLSSSSVAASAMTPDWAAHISEYPQAWVSTESPLRVRFSHPVASAEMLNKPLGGVLEVQPKVAISVSFTAENELRIEPVERLPNDQVLTFSLHADQLHDVDHQLKPFVFDVHTLKQDFDLKLGALAVQEDANNLMRLAGEVHTTDTAELAQVEQLISVRVNKQLAKLQWRQAEDQKTYYFVLEDIARSEHAGDIDIEWDGAALGSSTKGARKLVLPATADFVVTGVQVVRKPETYIEVNFSAPLYRHQNLAGLVRLGGQDPKVQIDGSALRIYPTDKIKESLSDPQELLISGLLHNSLRTKLGEDYRQTVVLALVQPSVNFIGADTSILPSAKQLSVPFEAAGIDSVQVVAFKIYDNNIGQYLQRNRLSSAYPDQATGRYLWRKVYRLPEIPHSGKQRFNLDLTELMAQNPDGLVRIELHIDRSNAIFDCAQERPSEPRTDLPENEEGEGYYERESIPQWYQQYYQNTGFYTYSERNNPCHDAYYYYGENTSSARTFVVSNIGLLAKRGSNNVVQVIATSLNDATPLAGADIQVFNFQQQRIGTGQTDHYGMVDITTDGTPFYLLAEYKQARSYLRMPRNEALPTNQFDVSGEHVKAGLKGFIYGERDVWRPGDDIHLTFILQDREQRIPAGHPVRLDFFDPRGVKHSSQTNVQPVNDFYSFTLSTDESSPTGNWRAVVHVGNRYFDQIIKVETVTPNRLKVELTPAQIPLRADNLPMSVAVFGQWLHGASASGLKADSEVKLFSRKTQFDGYQQFIFDDPVRNFETSAQKVFEGKLDREGKASFTLDLTVESPPPGMLTALFNTRIFEESGNFSTALRTFDFQPFDHWVGLQVPKGDGYSDAISRDDDHPVHFQALDRMGKAAADRKLEVTVYALSWRWWWDDSGDDLASYVGGEHHAALQTVQLTTNAQGRAEWTLAKNTYDWGRHLIRVCDTASDHCAGQVVYLGWSWNAQKNPESATQLMLTTDREHYQPGDSARVRLPKTAEGRVLLSLENGSRVLARRWVDLPKGETELVLPVTADMAPNVYVHITLLLPHQERASDAPMRLYGIVPLLVEDPATRLQPQLTVADEVRPETEFSIAVSEKNQHAMTYTLALVDEGLLGLTGFSVPDAHQYFYRREALGVLTWDLFDQVVGAYGASLERVLAIGGSDAAQDAERKRRERRFPPVVKFLGTFSLAAGETRSHSVTLPPYMGAVRVMLVAGDASAENYAYGKAEQTVTVTQPLVLLATLPRVVGPGEEVWLPVNVFVSDAKIDKVTVSIAANDVFTVVDTETELRFTEPGDAITRLRLKVNDRVGKGWVKITARSGDEVAIQEIYIDSRAANPPSVIWQEQLLAPGEVWQSTVIAQGMAGTNVTTLEVSSLPALGLERRLDYLLQYPHGCLEQVASAAFPQLHLGLLTDLNDTQKIAIDRNIAVAIKKLGSMQQSNGGFSYWSGDSYINDWATSYAGHFLLQAKRAGYAVPSVQLDNWLTYQHELARHDSDAQRTTDSVVAAYRLYTLVLAESADLPAMNRLRERLQEPRQPASARWLLALAYQHLGLKDVVSELLGSVDERLLTAIPTYSEQGYTYGSALRDRSLLLLTLTRTGSAESNLAWQLAESIAGELASDTWLSTQTTAWALMAMSEFADTTAASKDELRFSLRETPNATWQNLQSIKSLYRQTVTDTQVSVRNDSEHKLRIMVSNRGTPASSTEAASSNGLQLQVNFLTLNNKPLNVEQLPQGTDFIAEVTVTGDFARLTHSRLEDIALSMVMPSGWQIRNERLEHDQLPKGIDFIDIRDDRMSAYFSLWQDYRWGYRYHDRNQTSVTVRVQLNASYAGKFYLPGWQVNAMYDERIQARTQGYWVEVNNN